MNAQDSGNYLFFLTILEPSRTIIEPSTSFQCLTSESSWLVRMLGSWIEILTPPTLLSWNLSFLISTEWYRIMLWVCFGESLKQYLKSIQHRAWQGSQRELLAHAHTQCPWLSMGPSLHTCLETYDVLVFIHTRLSSLQQPPHRNTLTQGGLKKVLVLLPSSLATSTHVSRGLHWVRCHSSSITAQGKLMEACRD